MVVCKIERIKGRTDLYSFSIYSGSFFICTGTCSKIVNVFFEFSGENVYSVQRKNYLGIYESLFSCPGKMILKLGEGVSEDIIEKETKKIRPPTADKVIE
jgi:hypothetical protein